MFVQQGDGNRNCGKRRSTAGRGRLRLVSTASPLSFRPARPQKPFPKSNRRGSAAAAAGKQLCRPICVQRSSRQQSAWRGTSDSCLIHAAVLPVSCHFNSTSGGKSSRLTRLPGSQNFKILSSILQRRPPPPLPPLPTHAKKKKIYIFCPVNV